MKKKIIVSAVLIGMLLMVSYIILTSSQRETLAQQIPVPLPPESANVQISSPSFDLNDYRIVYLADEAAVSPESLVSPNGLLAEMPNANIASQWDDVIEFDREASLDALIVHESSFEAVDTDWTKQAVRNGLVVATINMYALESAVLRGSLCDQQAASSQKNPFEGKGDYYLIITYLIHADDPTRQTIVEDSAFNDCREMDGTYSYSHGSHKLLKTTADLDYFAGVLAAHIHGVRDSKQAFANRHLPATAVPEQEK